MTNKTYYAAAAAEVAAGHLDSALWIKVNAEMPGADNNARQAKYIALRAQELAVEHAHAGVVNWWRRVPRWAKVLGGAVIIYLVLGAIIQSAFAA